MVWKHHYSLLVSAGVTVFLVLARPESEWVYTIPLTGGSWGMGHFIIHRLEHRPGGRETAELGERLKREVMVAEHERDMRNPLRRDIRRDNRNMAICGVALILALCFILWLAGGGAEWLTGLVTWPDCECP